MPNDAIILESILPSNLLLITSPTKHPKPLGIIDNPLVKESYPIIVCINCGSIASDPNKIAFNNVKAIVPVVKFQFFNTPSLISVSFPFN